MSVCVCICNVVYEVIALHVCTCVFRCVCVEVAPYNAPNGSSGTFLLPPFCVACVGCMIPVAAGTVALLCATPIIVGCPPVKGAACGSILGCCPITGMPYNHENNSLEHSLIQYQLLSFDQTSKSCKELEDYLND